MGFGIDVEQDYFHWLCELINAERDEDGYWLLAKKLHSEPFYSFVPHDENRAKDGLELREEYLSMTNYPKYVRLDIGDCTVLEMLIGLARRIDYETASAQVEVDNTDFWFWEMIRNLGLEDFSDSEYMLRNGDVYVEEAIIRFLERKYFRNGKGGLFPLKNPTCDQRKIEIWYQMNNYLIERDAG